MKLKPEELSPLAAAIVERLVPILQNMNSMPRSIVENRYGNKGSHAMHPVRIFRDISQFKLRLNGFYTVHLSPAMPRPGVSCNLSQLVAAVHPGCACSAITLGRVAWVCPGQIAPHLAHFVGPWCNALRSIRDDVEKEHAFSGLCALLRANPEVLPRMLLHAHSQSHPRLCPPSCMEELPA